MKYLLLAGSLLWPVHSILAQPSASAEHGFSGKVVETTNTAGYTYVLVDTGLKKIWAATPELSVKPGDDVAVAAGMPMENYHSKSLNRDFDKVYFVGSITVKGAPVSALPPGHPALTNDAAAPALPPGHPPLDGAPKSLPPGHPALNGKVEPTSPLDLTGLKRAGDGRTVQEIYASQSDLSGKTVVVRGKVVKYKSKVLGKNWLHIRDGSGSAEKGDHDLTITTATEAKVGDTVLVSGIVTLNKDFGAGYKYAVIIENAQVTVE